MLLTGLVVDYTLRREVVESARERINLGSGRMRKNTHDVSMSLYTPPMFSFKCLRTAGNRLPSAPQIPSQSTCATMSTDGQGEQGRTNLAQPAQVKESQSNDLGATSMTI